MAPGVGSSTALILGSRRRPRSIPPQSNKYPSHMTPPHLPTKRDSRVPSAHIEEVTEAHIVQIIDDDDHSDSDDEDPIDFFQAFATERKKRESRRSNLPEFQSPTP